MKALIFLFSISLLFNIESFCQNINGYKYIFVRDIEYQNGKDIYGVSSYLRGKLKQIGFVVIDNNPPNEVIENKCLLLTCRISTSEGYNSVVNSRTGIATIALYDCENNIVFNGSGTTSFGSPLNMVYQKSVDRALKNLYYKYDPKKNHHEITPLFPKVEKTNETEETIKEYLSSNILDPLEGIYKSYQDEGLSYYKIGIIKRLFKIHIEIRLTINRIMDNWIKAIPDSGNLS